MRTVVGFLKSGSRSSPFAELARQKAQSCLQASWQIEFPRPLLDVRGSHDSAGFQTLRLLCPSFLGILDALDKIVV